MDTIVTMLVNAGNGARISDGVDQQAVRASRAFPYLLPQIRTLRPRLSFHLTSPGEEAVMTRRGDAAATGG